MRRRFRRFFLVGISGFFTDITAFTLIFFSLQNPYLSRIFSFLIAVCVTFALNKSYTFRDKKTSRPWAYLLTQMIGAGINMLVFTIIIWHSYWQPYHYYLGLTAGSLAAMLFNFEMSKRHVFS